MTSKNAFCLIKIFKLLEKILEFELWAARRFITNFE